MSSPWTSIPLSASAALRLCLFRLGRFPIFREVAIPTSPLPGRALTRKLSPFARLPVL